MLEFSRKVLAVQKNAEAEDICNIFSITHNKPCKITKATAQLIKKLEKKTDMRFVNSSIFFDFIGVSAEPEID